DGIRDRNVTGVQTCALPISWDPTTGAPLPIPTDGQKNRVVRFGYAGSDTLLGVGFDGIARVWELPSGQEKRAFRVSSEETREVRSEERRVGKEWSGQGSGGQ